MTYKNYITALIILIVLLVLYFGATILRDKRNANTSAPRLVENSTVKNVEGFRYEYIPDAKSTDEYDMNNNDGRIVRIDTVSGQSIVLVSSVKALFPNLQPGTSLYHLATSADNAAMYFTIAYGEGAAGIYKFDLTNKKFSELKISKQYDSMGSSVSPTSAYIVTVINPDNPADDHSLFVLDLDKDSSKLLTKFPVTQTINICTIQGCLGPVLINPTWLDDKNFEINIYDTKPGPIDPQTGGPEAKLIEKRKFTIQ